MNQNCKTILKNKEIKFPYLKVKNQRNLIYFNRKNKNIKMQFNNKRFKQMSETLNQKVYKNS